MAQVMGMIILTSPVAAADLVLSGSYGLTAFRPGVNAHSNGTIDATAARFVVANSRNENPTPAKDCESGTLATNPYPVNLSGQPGATFRGGLIESRVPQASEWRPTYCNSAAIAFFESGSAAVEDVRITGAWDAIRFARNSGDFSLKSAWISNVRDDCVENDQLKSGEISDVLFDGCFQGISTDPGKDSTLSDQRNLHTVVLDRVLMRLKPYLYRKNDSDPLEPTHGHIFKSATTAPSFVVRNSVFAYEVEPFASDDRLTNILGRLKGCENNQVLWLADGPLPAFFQHFPRSCFSVEQGQEARATWQAARQRWIDCHPDHLRGTEDPVADATACAAADVRPLPPHDLTVQ